MKIKKKILVSSLAMALGTSTASNAAFTPLGAGDYVMNITGGCFEFGNCQTTGNGAFTDLSAGQEEFTINANTVLTGTSGRSIGDTVGSGSLTSGDFGTINFSVDSAGAMTITSFAQTSYLATAGGTFYVDAKSANGTSAMTGTIDGAGNVLFTPIGREGLAASFATGIGVQAWNDSKKIGMYDSFSTGTTTNDAKGANPAFSVTGVPLQDVGVSSNTWSGQLAATGNINGDKWTGFNNVQYSEIFDFTISLVSADPVANDDTISGPVNTPIVINIANDLLANDSHADQTETLTFDSFTQPTSPSSVVDNSDGTLTYTPDPALTEGIGVDSFTYTILDSNLTTAVGTVSVTLAGGSPPDAMDDSISATEDTAVTFNPVLGGGFAGVVDDTDPDAGQVATLTISAVDSFSANGGTITVSGNDLTYTAAQDFNTSTSGVDTFNYTVQDSTGLMDTAVVTVNVAAVNDAPVCLDVSLTTATNTELTIDESSDLLSNTTTPPLCVDAEGDAISLSSFDSVGSNGGTLSTDGAGNLTYTPPNDFIGTETFSYTATDPTDASSPNTLTINVANPLADNFTMLEKSGNVFGGTNDVVFVWDETTFNTNTLDANGIPTDTNYGVMTIASPERFFGFNWTAHRVRVFKNTTSAPIEYKFDVTCLKSDYDSGIVDCNRPLAEQDAADRFLVMTLQPGEIGGHILFDWNTSSNIDVINVWQENAPWESYSATSPTNDLWLGEAGLPPSPTTDWRLVSIDVPGDGVDGIHGSKMIDGPFKGFFANFNYKPLTAGTKLPPVETDIKNTEASFSMGIWSLLISVISIFGLRKKIICK